MSGCGFQIDPIQPLALSLPTGTVTSVAVAAPAQFSVAGSPIVAAGTITLAWVSQAQNLVFASPDGAAGVPTFRSLTINDLPALNYWSLTGNAGTTPVTNYVGTSDAQDFTLGVNGNIHARFYQANVGNIMLSSGASKVLNSSASNIIGIGSNVFGSTGAITGAWNFAFGENVLSNVSSGSINFGAGYYALDSLTTGTGNFAFGENALRRLTSGGDSIAIGRNVLQFVLTNSNNIGMGNGSLSATTGPDNIGLGLNALQVNTSGYRNIAIGTKPLLANTIGYGNIALGYYPAYTAVDGLYNISIGYESGGAAFTSGDKNIFLGYQAKAGGTYDNTIVIGNAITAAASNEIRIGNATNNKCFIPAVYNATSANNPNVYVDSNGQLFRSTATLTGLPSGVNYQTLVNVSGTWTATSLLTWDNTNRYLGIDIAVPLNDLSFGSILARTIAVERHASGGGKDLSINAGAGASGASDLNGGNLNLSPGLSTGVGFQQVTIKRYTRAASTGSSDNLENDAFIVPSEQNLSTGVAAGLFRVACGSVVGVGGTIDFSIEATDGTDITVYTGSVHYAAVNKAGSYTTSIVEESATTIASGGGATITTAWTVANGGGSNYVEIRLTATIGGITPTKIKLRYKVHNGSDQAITIL